MSDKLERSDLKPVFSKCHWIVPILGLLGLLLLPIIALAVAIKDCRSGSEWWSFEYEMIEALNEIYLAITYKPWRNP